MLVEVTTKPNSCPHCGSSMRVWRHSLTRGLVDVLLLFIGAVKSKGMNSVHLQQDMNLSKNQYANFQKLHYFGLVAKDRDRSGYWVITRLGGDFLRGTKTIPKFALTYHDRLVEREGELVGIKNYYRERADDYWQSTFSFEIFQGQLI